MTDTSFAALPLPDDLRPGLDALGYTAMTPIQAAALPPILDGRDVIAHAPTGSGKTAAFGLGLLARVDAAQGSTQALVLCPTRELADQVARQLRTLATGRANLKIAVLCGGIPLAPQLASLAHAPHVVVGTPGRVLELAERDALHLSRVQVVVLDEADRMLDMGFEADVRALVRRTHGKRQGLLFSATFPDAIRTLAAALLKEPVDVGVDGDAQQPAIEQVFVEAQGPRAPLVAALLLAYRPTSSVVFCNTRKDVDELAGSLAHYGFDALALHGDMEQRDREEVLVRFANRSAGVLVATDVAARGLDIEGLDAVVNVEPPSDADTWLHRIGRTGRAGAKGLALCLIGPRDGQRAEMIEARVGAGVIRREAIEPVSGKPRGVPVAAMRTLRIDAGRTDKLRPGDIVGALTGEAGLHKDALGKIDVYPTRSYVAIARGQATRALEALRAGRIKGRRFRVSAL